MRQRQSWYFQRELHGHIGRVAGYLEGLGAHQDITVRIVDELEGQVGWSFQAEDRREDSHGNKMPASGAPPAVKPCVAGSVVVK